MIGMFSVELLKSGVFSVILSATILFVFASIGVSGAAAQKRSSTKKSVQKKPVEKKAPTEKNYLLVDNLSESDGVFCIPPQSDYASVLRLDKNSNLTVTMQIEGESKVLYDARPMSELKNVLSGIDRKSVITFQADPSLGFDSVVKVLGDLRRAINNCVNVEASTKTENPYVYIPPVPNRKNLTVKTNPLTLIARLDKNANLSLNNQEEGSLANTSKLINTLRQVFKAREDKGTVRKGTNIIETTVFIKASRSRKFGDVVKLVDAVKEAGAERVGLQLDNLESGDDFIIQMEVTKP